MNLLAAVLVLLQPAPQPLQGDVWEALAQGPGSHSRNNVWNTGFNIPPFENTTVVPPGVLALRAWLDGTDGKFAEGGAGGRSTWHNLWIEGGVQADYGVIPNFQVGLRLSAGALKDQGGDGIRLFDRGEQIADDLDDGFTLHSLVLRGKYADRLKDYFDFAVLVEAKAPLSGGGHGAGSDTFDFGIALLASREVVPDLRLHVSLGVVAPAGESGLFIRDDEARLFYTWGFGVAFRASDVVAFFAQLEGNTSPWTHLDRIAQTAATAGAGVRWRLLEPLILEVQAGGGLEEIATDWYAAVSVTYALRLR